MFLDSFRSCSTSSQSQDLTPWWHQTHLLQRVPQKIPTTEQSMQQAVPFRELCTLRASFPGPQRKGPETEPCTGQELPRMEGSKQSCASIPSQHSPPCVTAFISEPWKKSITFLASSPASISHAARPPHGHPARVAEPQPRHPCPAPHLPLLMFPQARGTAGQMSCYFKGWLPWEAKRPEQVGQEGLQGTGRCLRGCTARGVKPHDGMPGPAGDTVSASGWHRAAQHGAGEGYWGKAAPALSALLGIAAGDCVTECQRGGAGTTARHRGWRRGRRRNGLNSRNHLLLLLREQP